MKLLIIVFLYRRDLFSDVGKLAYLVLDLVLEEADFIFQVFNAQLVKHHNVVVSVFTKQTLEAD